MAAYRVSRKVSTFILFFSEALTNSLSLVNSVVTVQILILVMGEAGAGNLFQTNLIFTTSGTLFTYSSLLHNLLIAVNWAFSVLFPLHYDEWWTRRVIITLTLSVWAVNIMLKAIEFIMSVLIDHNSTFFYITYSILQPVTTYAALALYAVSLLWLLVRQLLGAGGCGVCDG